MRRYIYSIYDHEIPVYDFDVVIVGSGVAGLYCALHLDSSLNCAVVTKANIDESNSYLAQGGIAAVISSDDKYDLHIEDTLKAGAGLCNVDAVNVLVRESTENIQTLIKMAIPFDLNPEGELQITKEGGHGMRRIVHCGGDATGRETTKQLGKLALTKENLHFFFGTYLVDIITDTSSAQGVIIFAGDDYRLLRSRNIVIATGGIGQVYRYTTNPVGAVGDGMAAAARAGAVMRDMEFVQFHPTTLFSRNYSKRLFLISEAVRGEGGILRNSRGDAFMQGKHPMADLAPRDIVTREMIAELNRIHEENIYLDVSMMSEEFFSKRFPTIFGECRDRGINVPSEWIPVRPAQHYMMGGIATDLNGMTNIDGLYSAGESAHTGIHGGNRLASNSILECLVFGRRCAYHINNNFRPLKSKKASYEFNEMPSGIVYDTNFYEKIKAEIKSVMNSYANAERTVSGLAKAKNILDNIFSTVEQSPMTLAYEFEVFNMLSVARMIVNGAVARKDSVGAHYIIDK